MHPKPANLVYGVEDKPPFVQLLLLALQHVSVLFAISNVFPVIVGQAVNAPPEQIKTFVSMSMLACGIGTMLQAMNRFSIGSGYLCPQGVGPSYLSSSIQCVQSAGFHVLFGMTFIAGIIESLFSRFVHRARFLFPTEVTGTLVTMVGVAIVPLGVRYSTGMGIHGGERDNMQLLVAVLTFGSMIGFNVFTKGLTRLYCVLIGCALGYGLSYYLGILTAADMQTWSQTPWFAFPDRKYFGLSFRWSYFGPFALAAAASTFKSIGDVALCQKINDSEWKRPDMVNISNGINADGWASTVSGLLGGMGPSTYSSSIGVSVATGATSRAIAYAMGAILILLSFTPKFAAIFVIMPRPVIGASVVFAICFMLLTGIQIIQSRLLDTRKIFVIGISLALGLSVDMVPEAYRNVPSWLAPFTGSSLAFSTVVVILLNLVMRLGIKKTVNFEFQTDQKIEKISSEIELQGGAWGARKDVIYRALSAIKEFLGSSKELEIKDGLIRMEVSFDEFNLDIRIAYHGNMMPLPEERPLRAEFRTDDQAVLKLSGFMIRQYCDRFQVLQKGDEIQFFLHFDH